MNTTNILIVISSSVFIVFIWAFTAYRHFNILLSQISAKWDELNEKLKKRQDLIPNLIETVRLYRKDDKLINTLIDQRIRTAHVNINGGNKIELEHDFSISINRIFFLGLIEKELQQDTNFQEIRKDIDDMEVQIEKNQRTYNEIIRKYNSQIKFFLLKPVSLLFGFKQRNIFEFEG